VNLTLQFNTCIKILLSLKRLLLDSIILRCFKPIDSYNAINLDHFVGSILYAHIASFIHFVYNICYIFTLVIPVLS